MTKEPKEKIKELLEKKKKDREQQADPQAQNDQLIQEAAAEPGPDHVKQTIDALQNPGLYRANMIELLQQRNDILIEMGKSLLERLDRLCAAIESVTNAETPDDADEEGQ